MDLSRRGLVAGIGGLVAHGGLPRRRIDQAAAPAAAGGLPAPQGGPVLARTVVIYGPGITGEFIYQGLPGHGNPPVAWANPPGVTVDPYGNALPVNGGFSVIGTGQIWASLTGGNLNLNSANPSSTIAGGGIVVLTDALTAAAQPAISVVSPVTSAAGPSARINVLGQNKAGSLGPQVQVTTGPTVVTPVTGALLEVDGAAAVQLIGAIVGGAAETLHAFTPANSWAQAAANPTWGYERLPDGMVAIVGAVTVPTGFAARQAMAAATPVAYQPAHAQTFTAWDVTTGNPVRLSYSAGGVLSFIGPVASTAAGDVLLLETGLISLTA